MSAGLREERRIVTALFADLVGSTTLAEQLDPEDVRLVVADAVARVIGEVERLGGHVKDIAGDGVLAFFGAPIASEDDPERAVRAGLGIVAEMAVYGGEVERGFGVPDFGVRVGVGTGQLVLATIEAGSVSEYAAFGDTVNTAARLQGHARPGTVLVDRETQRLVEPLFEWSDPLELDLKGKAERAVAYEVRSERTGASRGRPFATPLVGREREWTAAAEALETLRAGTGGILFVTGEPGIGKSRLLAELHNGFGGLWLEGRCVSYGESLPYWPFREAVREWLSLGVDDPELRARIALRRAVEGLFDARAPEVYPYLGSLLGLTLEPEASARLSELSPEALQYRTFEVVGTLLARLAADGPLVLALEDLHWADATSVQLVERLLAVGEQAPVLLAFTQRAERDHLSWRLKELAAREFPHLTREVPLEPLSGEADRELLRALVGDGTLPADVERGVLDAGEGNPFFLEELVRSLADSGALARTNGSWRFDHDVKLEIPQTVEKVILARIDRLAPESHRVLIAASALGRRFGLALLEGVLGDGGEGVRAALHELQRVDLVRPGRSWPEPEYRFKHVLIQEAAYGTLVSETRRALHRAAAEWLESRHADDPEEILGLLAHHWLAAQDEEKAIAYLTRAGDWARQQWALDEAIGHYRALLPLLEQRGARREMALVLFKLGLALHTDLRFGEANDAFRRAFDIWEAPPPCTSPTATLRIATNRMPAEPDPPRSYNLPDIQLQMALFDRLVERWPEATIVPSLAERWEVSADGLRYLFHLRDGLQWSDGTPLTAHDVEYGIKRVLDPERPGISVSIFYVLEHAQDYALGRSSDSDRIGVRALDDRTVEFRLVAPAPYFLSVVNRPDGGPQPRHAIERHGDAWLEPERGVVSGAFGQAERSKERLVLERRPDAERPGNVARVEIQRTEADEAVRRYRRDEVDVAVIVPTSRMRELEETAAPDRQMGPPALTLYLAFDHTHPLAGNRDLRRALALGLDRDALQAALPADLLSATGGVVPPALQGHTPDIAPRFDPDRAREHLRRSGARERLVLARTTGTVLDDALEVALDSWSRVLGDIVETAFLAPAEWLNLPTPWDIGQLAVFPWFPGYPDPEYFLRLLLHSDSTDNQGRWSHLPFDELVESARHEPDARTRLELFHEADRMAVAEEVAVIPLVYGRSVFYVKPWVRGWWEFGKSWSSFADLDVTTDSPRRSG